MARDLDIYREMFNLPACTTGNGCFNIVKAGGSENAVDDGQEVIETTSHLGTSRTAGLLYNINFAAEQAQMLQGISATCPECRIALVISKSSYGLHIASAFRLAQSLRPDFIVTRINQPTNPDRTTAPIEDPRLYLGALVLAGSGVLGYTSTRRFPGRLPTVASVGATEIDGAGRVIASPSTDSFCNRSFRKPMWQAKADTGCNGRAGTDLVAPGATTNGMAVFISGGLYDGRGWYHLNHSPQAVAIVGGLLARHGLGRTVRAPADLYRHPEWFTDIVAGSNDCAAASTCSTSRTACPETARRLCTAGEGWDGPTGLGEPRNLPWK